MATTRMRPPAGADVRRVSSGSRTYVPGRGGAWMIDDEDADDLRRAGWADDVPAATGEGSAAPAPASAPEPEPEA